MLAFWSADVTDRVVLQVISQERELGDSCMFKLDSQATTVMILCRSYATFDSAAPLAAVVDVLFCIASCQQMFLSGRPNDEY